MLQKFEPYWKINEEKTQSHWLVVEDTKGWYSAIVKWDGCVDFTRVHNLPLPIQEDSNQLVDHIHYCDIDEEIERLIALKKKAIEFFGKDWNS